MQLREAAALIPYEEYHPYGTTSYRAAPSATEVSAKRYRYNGKERDEETGLYDYGARYYAAWLGRWMSADPLGVQAGLNLYLFCRAGPVNYVDPDGREGKDWKKVLSEGAWSLTAAMVTGGFSAVAESAGDALAPEFTRDVRTKGGEDVRRELSSAADAARDAMENPGGLALGLVLAPGMTGSSALVETLRRGHELGDESLAPLASAPVFGESRESIVSALATAPANLLKLGWSIADSAGMPDAANAAKRASLPGSGPIRGGAGGRWKTIGKREGGAVPQLLEESCGAACGEMLSGVPQQDLIKTLGPNAVLPEELSRALGPGWRGGTLPDERADTAMMAHPTSWIALMRTPQGGRVGHFVVVDGQTPGGQMRIRDPAEGGSTYRMAAKEFEAWWLRGAVWKAPPARTAAAKKRER